MIFTPLQKQSRTLRKEITDKASIYQISVKTERCRPNPYSDEPQFDLLNKALNLYHFKPYPVKSYSRYSHRISTGCRTVYLYPVRQQILPRDFYNVDESNVKYNVKGSKPVLFNYTLWSKKKQAEKSGNSESIYIFVIFHKKPILLPVKMS